MGNMFLVAHADPIEGYECYNKKIRMGKICLSYKTVPNGIRPSTTGVHNVKLFLSPCHTKPKIGVDSRKIRSHHNRFKETDPGKMSK